MKKILNLEDQNNINAYELCINFRTHKTLQNISESKLKEAYKIINKHLTQILETTKKNFIKEIQ